MTTFKILFQTESNGEYTGFSINEYSVEPWTNEEQVLLDFLTPQNFKHEDFHLIKRLDRYKDEGFLGHALNLEKVTLSDFRKVNKEETVSLLDLEIPRATRTGKNHPARLVLGKLVSLIDQVESDNFYYVSSMFFPQDLIPSEYNDKKQKLLFDGLAYDPYVLIIWFTVDRVLHVCEYSAD